MRRHWLYLIAVACAVLGYVAHQRAVASVVERARSQEAALWQGAQSAALAEATKKVMEAQTQLVISDMRNRHELNEQRSRMEAAVAASARTVGSLQHTVKELRDRLAAQPGAAEPGTLAYAATSAADALGECSARRTEVAAVADKLAVQVTGLQRYITDVVGPVCLKEPDHDG